MFEKMKNNVTRIPGNLTKLNQYQKDIDHLSKLFSEQQLLELMTTTESDQILQMKPAVDILHVLSPSASTAKHINFFQHVPVLEQWLKRSALPLIYWQYISIHSNPVKCHSERNTVCYWMHLLKLNFHLRLMVIIMPNSFLVFKTRWIKCAIH